MDTSDSTKTVVKVQRVDKAQKHREAVKKYYDKHKDEKEICPICLGKISFSNKWNHKQSKLHLRHVARLEELEAEKEKEKIENS